MDAFDIDYSSLLASWALAPEAPRPLLVARICSRGLLESGNSEEKMIPVDLSEMAEFIAVVQNRFVFLTCVSRCQLQFVGSMLEWNESCRSFSDLFVFVALPRDSHWKAKVFTWVCICVCITVRIFDISFRHLCISIHTDMFTPIGHRDSDRPDRDFRLPPCLIWWTGGRWGCPRCGCPKGGGH